MGARVADIYYGLEYDDVIVFMTSHVKKEIMQM